MVISESCLLQSRIDRIIASMTEQQLKDAADIRWWVYPSDCISNKERCEYIICAIPNAGALPDYLIKMQLLQPIDNNFDRDDPMSNTAIYKRLFDELGISVMDCVAKQYASYRLCPDKYKQNTEFMCLCYIITVIDDILRDDCMVQYDDLYDIIVMWFQKAADTGILWNKNS